MLITNYKLGLHAKSVDYFMTVVNYFGQIAQNTKFFQRK